MNPPNRSLIYRISRNGHVMGEYDIDRIVELLDSGEFLWTDLCWAQGMAGWVPLSALRSEVAAAKAFPPVAAMSAPVASGRRRTQVPPAQVSAPQPAPSGVAGWWWIVGGVVLGALVGLLVTHLFPNIVHVDRPVEKVVEKPVEVVRTVEKVVDRKIDLSIEEKEMLVLGGRILDPTERVVGVRLFKISDRVKIFYEVEGKGRVNVNSGAIVSRVESAFRGHGFTVLPKDSKETPYSIVKIGGLFLEQTNSNGLVLAVSGSYRVSIAQPLIALNPFDASKAESRIIKVGIVDLYSRQGAIDYGSDNFNKIPDVFARAAETCAEELRKAQNN